jgi:hypothetical protein
MPSEMFYRRKFGAIDVVDIKDLFETWFDTVDVDM